MTGKNKGDWPYHEDPHGNWVACSSNPCKLHSSGDIMATSPEDAFAKADRLAHPQGEGGLTGTGGKGGKPKKKAKKPEPLDMLHVQRRVDRIGTEASNLQPSLNAIDFLSMEDIEDGEREGTPLTEEQYRRIAARTDTLLEHTKGLKKEYDDFIGYISKEAGVEHGNAYADDAKPAEGTKGKPGKKAEKPEPLDMLHLQRRIGKVGAEASILQPRLNNIDFSAMESIEDGENEEGTPLTKEQHQRIAARSETLLEHTRGLQKEYDGFIDYISKEAGVERREDRLSG